MLDIRLIRKWEWAIDKAQKLIRELVRALRHVAVRAEGTVYVFAHSPCLAPASLAVRRANA
jgi:hypothetical protein